MTGLGWRVRLLTDSIPVQPTSICEMYNTYVLYSPRFNKIYVGFSGDIHNRLLIHNNPDNRGWTVKFQPWDIFYSEEFMTKAEAMKREKQLKSSRGRVFIWGMINCKNKGNHI